MPIWSQRTTRAGTQAFPSVWMQIEHFVTQWWSWSIHKAQEYHLSYGSMVATTFIRAGLLWMNSILGGGRWGYIAQTKVWNRTLWATLPGHMWSNTGQQKSQKNGYRRTALSFLLWDVSNNASRWCWLPTSQLLGHLHVKCIYIL